MAKEYAVYKGDDLLCIGTVDECAQELKVKPETVLFYQYSKGYKSRGKRGDKRRRVTIALDAD